MSFLGGFITGTVVTLAILLAALIVAAQFAENDYSLRGDL